MAGKKLRIEELERLMEEPDFWEDTEKSQKTMKELKDLKNTIEQFEGLQTMYDDIATLLEMGYEEEDAEIEDTENAGNDGSWWY